MSNAKILTLNNAQQARLFLQLAQLESSGIAADQAFTLIAKNSPELRKALMTLPRRLRKGQGIADAGLAAGIFDPTQKMLVQAAEQGGTLTELYRTLADYHGGVARRRQKMLSRLTLPALTTALAFFIGPLPGLVLGKLNFGEYLEHSLLPLMAMSAGIIALLNLPRWLNAVGQAAVLDRWQLLWPTVANWVTQRQLNAFFFRLAMLLAAGVAFGEALPLAVAGIGNSVLRAEFSRALTLSQSGGTVVATLRTVPVIPSAMLQSITVGEQSGRLAETLRHFADSDAQTLALQDETFAEWLPRIIYGLVGLGLALGILAQGLPLPPI